MSDLGESTMSVEQESDIKGSKMSNHEEKAIVRPKDDVKRIAQKSEDTDPKSLRRSERKPVMTERMKKYKAEKLIKEFWKSYDVYSSIMSEYEVKLNEPCKKTELQTMENVLMSDLPKVENIYESVLELIDEPDIDVRRAIDRLNADRDLLLRSIRDQLVSDKESFIYSSAKSRSSVNSRRSVKSVLSIKMAEAAANVAARRAELECRKEEAVIQEELTELKRQELLRQAEHEALIKRKEQEIEQQRVERLLQIENAKYKVYVQELEQEEPTLFTKGMKDIKDQHSVTRHRSHADEEHTNHEIASLSEALVKSLALSRLPVPEPSIFEGDPLKYNEWQAAFNSLIEEKHISEQDKIYYLKKYVAGPAKEAVSGYLLLKSDNAFQKAKNVLERRFGDPFVISEAFRNKLDNWPKISPRDSSSLRRFSDFLNQCKVAKSEIKSLEILNDTRENRKMLQKLPDWIVTRWNRMVFDSRQKYGVYPNFDTFADFISQEAEISCDPVASLGSLRQILGPEKERNVPSNHKKYNKVNTLKTAAVENKRSKPEKHQLESNYCFICKSKGHHLSDCRTFSKRPHAEKEEIVKRNGLCFACLNYGHTSKLCEKKRQCGVCKRHHPTSLHKERESNNGENIEHFRAHTSQDETEVKTSTAVCHRTSHLDKQKIASSMILPVWVSSPKQPHVEHLVYALLDTQSDTSFMCTEVGDKLELDHEPATLKITTMTSDNSMIQCLKYYDIKVRGYHSDQKVTVPVAYSKDCIPVNPSHIATPEVARRCPHLKCIAEDIPPLQNCEVGMLIGYNCPQALAPRSVVACEGNQPFAVKTDLGWSIIGYSNNDDEIIGAVGMTHRVLTTEVPMDLCLSLKSELSPAEVKLAPTKLFFVHKTNVQEMLSPHQVRSILESDFATAEDEGKLMSQDDELFLKIIANNISQTPDGYYEMPLPFRNRPSLPDNRAVALTRLQYLKRRFIKDPKYRTDYETFMEDIIRRGEAEQVLDDDEANNVWYIPHHGVYHPHKPGKIRIVYDCATRYKGHCLNDHLLKGPDLINNLVGVLCRFRQERVAVVGDVERMFHQFRVQANDRDFLRFLWFDKTLQKVVDYRMKVHLFGAASSPGCANFGLKQIAMDHGHDKPEVAKFIQKNFYVDDGLISVASSEEAIQLVKNTRDVCAKGHVKLHKFISNDRDVMESIPAPCRAKGLTDWNPPFENLPVERILGVQWCVASDKLKFKVTLKDMPLTRRGILSTIASIYDPLGLLAPLVLIGKQILQQMCRDHVGWDEPLSEELKPRWERWRLSLSALLNIEVDRCYKSANLGKIVSYEMHHFSDASTQGYGQCSYLRLKDIHDEIYCTLLIGKARVAPLKMTTIPRLELQAAVVSSKISMLLRRELEYTPIKEYFWTDSKVVLGYVGSDAKRFHMFVANRIQAIRNVSSPNQWHYVSTEHNPADFASRGLYGDQLLSSNWFRGPAFLWNKTLTYDENDNSKNVVLDDPEIRKVNVLTTVSDEASVLINRIDRFSQWHSAVSAVCILQQCIINFKHKKSACLSDVSSRQRAEMTIIRMLQQQSFPIERKILTDDRQVKSISRQSPIYKLDPFLDDNGILRVGGRLGRAGFQYNVKHPIILPKKTHVTKLIVRYFHEKVVHQGRGFTLNAIRSNGYYIVGCTAAVSSCIFNCVVCRKFRGKTQYQKMGDLPEERMQPSPPFLYTGFDCFGPFTVKDGRKEYKRYGLIFTCMSSRAVHIEILDDLSTDAFLNGLRCFIALRGNVRQLRSDRGSNFIGAKNELSKLMNELDQGKLKTFLQTHGCDFVQHIPHSSHMGGVWERQIRSIRNILMVLLKNAAGRVNSSTLRTFFYEVMSIINSRPLSVENLTDPLGPEPITPNHLLTMKTDVISHPPGIFLREDLYGRRCWRKVQYLAERFWSQWQKEYLLNLQHRQKWNQRRRDFQVGDIVIVKEDNPIRSHWKLARVIEVFPSQDNIVRKVKLLIADSKLTDKGSRIKKPTILERPVNKLTLLLESSDEI